MTTQEVYNEAMDIVNIHGIQHVYVNAHNHFAQALGNVYSISLFGSVYVTTSNHASPVKALFELHTLLTELKAKSCIQDNPNP
jgi:hypothetical protein